MDPERTDPQAWLSHIAGIASLLMARGPRRHRLPLPRASLEHSRYNLVSSAQGARLRAATDLMTDAALHFPPQVVWFC